MMQCEHFLLHENGWVPNNEALPVLVYRGAVPGGGEEAAKAFEAMFARHGWPPQWRDVVYDYHHYHSTAHEALGVATGSALLTLGGPAATRVEVRAGDALVLPVGTGHRSVEASEDFLVVGAYPEGQDWDICLEAPSEAMRQRMRDLPVPDRDPVAGADGPLSRYWR
jgi:uncharacterized protein YjlB